MPSDALLAWQTERRTRLQNVAADWLHLEALHPADPDRVRTDCDALAAAFDTVLRNYLQATTGVSPWPP